MFKGFKDFLMRGNVIELAVAVVIGSAFGAIVKAFTDNLINPLIASLGANKVGGLGFEIRPGVKATFVDFGAALTGVVYFVIVAAVVYFVFVLPMNAFQARMRKAEAPPEPEATPEDVLLLREIRDLLTQPGSTGTGTTLR